MRYSETIATLTIVIGAIVGCNVAKTKIIRTYSGATLPAHEVAIVKAGPPVNIWVDLTTRDIKDMTDIDKVLDWSPTSGGQEFHVLPGSHTVSVGYWGPYAQNQHTVKAYSSTSRIELPLQAQGGHVYLICYSVNSNSKQWRAWVQDVTDLPCPTESSWIGARFEPEMLRRGCPSGASW
jgi:hypothetical protein